MARKKDTKDLSGVSVHAGFPNPAAESVLENPDFNRLLIKHPSATFCMHLQGNDWQDQGIFNGDIVVIDRTIDPKKTDLVVWWDSDSFVITKLSALPEEVEQWGTVSAIIHQFRI